MFVRVTRLKKSDPDLEHILYCNFSALMNFLTGLIKSLLLLISFTRSSILLLIKLWNSSTSHGLIHPIFLFLNDPSTLSSYSSSSSSICSCNASAFPLLLQGFYDSLALLPPFTCIPLSTISSTLPVSSSSSSSFSFVLQAYLSAHSFFSCSLYIFSSTSSCVYSSSMSPFDCSASSTLFLCSSLCIAAPILIFSLLKCIWMYF